MYCTDFQPELNFLLILSSADYIPRILYYFYIPAMIVSLFLGFFVYFKAKKKELLVKLFLAITASFFLYSFFVLVTWVNFFSNYVVISWVYSIFFNYLLVIFIFLFFEAFIDKLTFFSKKRLWPMIFSLPLLPLWVSNYFVISLEAVNCNVIENRFYLFYEYFFELFIIGYILFRGISECRNNKDQLFRKKIALLLFGISSFLIPYFFFCALASYFFYSGETVLYEVEPYGVLGYPIFLVSIVYLIVKYKLFNIKIHEGQALVFGLFFLVGAQLFYMRNSGDQVIVIITLVIAFIIGFFLIRSIRGEEEKKRKELEIVNQELLKLDRAKSEFINIASHQLRTPVTVIRGVISLIMSGKMEKLPEEERSQFYESIWNKSNKLEEIIKDILNAASLSNKKYVLLKNHTEKVDLGELISQIVNDFKSESERKGITIDYDKKKTGEFSVRGNKTDLKEVFNNIINNALKYTPSIEDVDIFKDNNRKRGNIKIIFSRKENKILISVKDNGIGIPKNEISCLFEKFYRASNAKKLYTDGSGLGLFIVREIIDGHRGEIWFESEINKGTTVFVKLPIK